MPEPSNPALTAALRASLALEEGRGEGAVNPLSEANPDSLDELFDRVNRKLAAGLPETIDENDLLPVVNALRAQRLKFQQDQERKAANGGPRRSTGTSAKSPAPKPDLSGLE